MVDVSLNLKTLVDQLKTLDDWSKFFEEGGSKINRRVLTENREFQSSILHLSSLRKEESKLLIKLLPLQALRNKELPSYKLMQEVQKPSLFKNLTKDSVMKSYLPDNSTQYTIPRKFMLNVAISKR